MKKFLKDSLEKVLFLNNKAVAIETSVLESHDQTFNLNPKTAPLEENQTSSDFSVKEN